MRAWRPWLLVLLLACGTVRGGEVRVAVAANMAAPMQRLAADFARASGHRARLAPGSTGRFYAQIRSGAPFEVLLAADEEPPGGGVVRSRR